MFRRRLSVTCMMLLRRRSLLPLKTISLIPIMVMAFG